MKLTKKGLFTLDAIFWLFAGFKVLAIANSAWQQMQNDNQGIKLSFIFLTLGTMFVFRYVIFRSAARKNISYIYNLPEGKHYFFHCMRPVAWFIMAFMITLGLCLRYSGLIPMDIIASFYTGLGVALGSTSIEYISLIFKKKN